MFNGNAHLTKEMETLKKDVSQLFSDFGGFVDSLIDLGKEDTQEAKQALAKLSRDMDKRVVEMRRGIGKARDNAEMFNRNMMRQIDRHPLAARVTAAAAILGIGYLAYKMVRRSL